MEEGAEERDSGEGSTERTQSSVAHFEDRRGQEPRNSGRLQKLQQRPGNGFFLGRSRRNTALLTLCCPWRPISDV